MGRKKSSPNKKNCSRKNGNGRLRPDEIKKFREILEKKRDELLGDMRYMKEEATSHPDSLMPIHMADIGSDNYEHEFVLELMQNDDNLLREIEDALERIKNGTYGICLATGKPISRERLRHKPWAKYCVEYVRKQEKKNQSAG